MTKATNKRESTFRITRPLRRDVDDLKKRMRAMEKAVAKLMRAR